jgi:predicted MPP superfamily phosphohydrolase
MPKRILYFTDAHFYRSRIPSHKLIDLGHKTLALKPDLVIFGGDAVLGISDRGLADPGMVSEYKSFHDLAEQMFPGFLSVWGNHDTGFKYIPLKPGGMSLDSYSEAEKYIGPPFQRKHLDGWSLLLLNSEIPRVLEKEHISSALREVLNEANNRQHQLVSRSLAEDQKIVIFIHDPFSFLDFIWPTIKHSPHRHKVHLVVAGHVHLAWVGPIIRTLYQEARKANVRIVPSLWELFGLYGGYGLIDLSEDRASLKLGKL